MSFFENDVDQSNLIDGSPLVYETRPDGAYVTVQDRQGEPLILALDMEDLKVFAEIWESHPDNPAA